MFSFMSFHCKCNIFNTDNIIPSVYLSLKRLYDSSLWMEILSGHTSQKPVDNHRGAVAADSQPERGGKTKVVVTAAVKVDGAHLVSGSSQILTNRTATLPPAAAGVRHTSRPVLSMSPSSISPSQIHSHHKTLRWQGGGKRVKRYAWIKWKAACTCTWTSYLLKR